MFWRSVLYGPPITFPPECALWASNKLFSGVCSTGLRLFVTEWTCPEERREVEVSPYHLGGLDLPETNQWLTSQSRRTLWDHRTRRHQHLRGISFLSTCLPLDRGTDSPGCKLLTFHYGRAGNTDVAHLASIDRHLNWPGDPYDQSRAGNAQRTTTHLRSEPETKEESSTTPRAIRRISFTTKGDINHSPFLERINRPFQGAKTSRMMLSLGSLSWFKSKGKSSREWQNRTTHANLLLTILH